MHSSIACLALFLSVLILFFWVPITYIWVEIWANKLLITVSYLVAWSVSRGDSSRLLDFGTECTCVSSSLWARGLSCNPNIYVLCVLIHICTKGEVGAVKLVKALQEKYFMTVPRVCFFYGSFLLLMFSVYHAFSSVHCSLVVTCWEGLTSWLGCVWCFAVFSLLSCCGVLVQVGCLM